MTTQKPRLWLVKHKQKPVKQAYPPLPGIPILSSPTRARAPRTIRVKVQEHQPAPRTIRVRVTTEEGTLNTIFFPVKQEPAKE